MAKQKENAVVHSQEQLADGIYSMWINTEAAKDAKPGQFISMYTTDGSKLLPRPISICEIDKENGRLRVVYRVTGPKTGTEEFSKLTFLKEEFEQNGELYISTEDGSVGTKGNVMDAIRENALEADMIYACGPTPMLRAIKQYAEENGIECYISLEERMACGIGACLACVCKSKEKDAHSNVNNKRICKDGPVFLSTEVEI